MGSKLGIGIRFGRDIPANGSLVGFVIGGMMLVPKFALLGIGSCLIRVDGELELEVLDVGGVGRPPSTSFFS